MSVSSVFLCRANPRPVVTPWNTLFRGFIEDYRECGVNREGTVLAKEEVLTAVRYQIKDEGITNK